MVDEAVASVRPRNWRFRIPDRRRWLGRRHRRPAPEFAHADPRIRVPPAAAGHRHGAQQCDRGGTRSLSGAARCRRPRQAGPSRAATRLHGSRQGDRAPRQRSGQIMRRAASSAAWCRRPTARGSRGRSGEQSVHPFLGDDARRHGPQSGGYRAAFKAAEDYDLWLRMARPAASPTSRTISSSTGNTTPTCRGSMPFGNRFRSGSRSVGRRPAHRRGRPRRQPHGAAGLVGRGSRDDVLRRPTLGSTVCSIPIGWLGLDTSGRCRTGCSTSITSSAGSPNQDCRRCCLDRRTGRPAASADFDADRVATSRPCARPRMARKIRVIAPPSAGGRDRGAIAPGFMEIDDFGGRVLVLGCGGLCRRTRSAADARMISAARARPS